MKKNFDCDVLKIDSQDMAESKFEIYLVSKNFENVSIINRHKMVMEVFKKEGIMNEIHAVTLKLKDIK